MSLDGSSDASVDDAKPTIQEKPQINKTENEENDKEIQIFREYAIIPTAHSDNEEIDYEPCIKFLKRQATELELPFAIYYPANDDNPVFVITWAGIDPRTTAIMLNSYMDVEPIPTGDSSHGYFDAEMDSNGDIFGHGVQSAKSVGLLYLAAIRALKKDGVVFKRTFHVVFMPDKENGGVSGMIPFIKSDDFKALKIGFCLDEGSISPDEKIPVYNAERCLWRFSLEIPGSGGHASLMPKYTAVQKLQYLLNRLMEWRDRQMDHIQRDPKMKIGDISSLNMTRIDSCGTGRSIPTKLKVYFDIYFSPNEDKDLMESLLQRWCKQESENIILEYEQKYISAPQTAVDRSNIFWMAFQGAINTLGLNIEVQTNPCATNSNYLREAGVPTLGFSPFNNTPMDGKEEYLASDTYLKAIDTYKEVITKLGNASKCYCAYPKPQKDH